MAQLSDEQLVELAKIPDGQTWYTKGEALNRACWNWALYGCEGGPDDDPAKLFDLINATDDNLDECKGLVPELWREYLVQLRQLKINGVATVDIVQRIFEISASIAGLNCTDSPTNYKLCMHWPTENGVTYEHWWIEVAGNITTEIIPAWGSIMIYRNRAKDAADYSQVSVFLKELKQAHIEQIMGVVLLPDSAETPPIRGGHGWS